jgi:hypothetical protein
MEYAQGWTAAIVQLQEDAAFVFEMMAPWRDQRDRLIRMQERAASLYLAARVLTFIEPRFCHD